MGFTVLGEIMYMYLYIVTSCQECNDIPNDDTSQYFIDDTRRLSYDIDATVRLGAPCDIGDIVSTDYFFSTKNLKSMK